MDKNIIKKRLTDKFISEDAVPGVSMINKMKKDETKINKDGVKAIEKEMVAYDKSLKQEDSKKSTMAVNKFNYTDDAEKIYHDEMETLNGQEMIKYASEPGEEFTKKAKESIEGSTRMGNAKAANAEETWGASSDDFGKKLVKRVKDSSKKRADAEIQTYGMGDVQIPTGRKVQTAITAVGADSPKGDTTKTKKGSSPKMNEDKITPNKQIKESMKRLKFKKPFDGVGNAIKLIPESYRTDNKEFEMTDGNETYRVRWEGNLSEGKAIILTATDKKMVTEDIARMKALFNYKSEDTLGLVKGNKRIDENAAFGDIWNKSRVLLGESETMIEKSAPKAKTGDLDDAVKVAPEAKAHVKGTASTDKGTTVAEPKTDEWEDANIPQAPEAKAHVEGTASTDKGTKAPKPKKGVWEKAKSGVAPEAQADVISEETMIEKEAETPKTDEWEDAKTGGTGEKMIEKETETPKTDEWEDAKTGGTNEKMIEKEAPEPKKGEWEKNVKGVAPEAKADIITATINENEEEEGEEVDTYYKTDDEDDTDTDAIDPTAALPMDDSNVDDDDEDDIVVPEPKKDGPRLVMKADTGERYIVSNGRAFLVPEHLLVTARANPSKALEMIRDEAAAKELSGEDELEEGWFGGKSPEELKKIGMEAINKHPIKRKTYQDLTKNYPDRVEKYVLFVGKNPEIKYIGWDDAKQDFASTGNFSVASGEGIGGK